MIARVATHPRRLAGDQRMLVGESDSYAGAIGRPDRDDRIVAVGIFRPRTKLASPFASPTHESQGMAVGAVVLLLVAFQSWMSRW